MSRQAATKIKKLLTQNKNCGKVINVAATGKREPTEQRQRKIKKLLTNKKRYDNISSVAKTTQSASVRARKKNKKVLDKHERV